MEGKKYKIIYRRHEDGRFRAIVPELLGCVAFGNTKSAALKNIEKAIVAYEESLKIHKQPAPL